MKVCQTPSLHLHKSRSQLSVFCSSLKQVKDANKLVKQSNIELTKYQTR